jgi:hypothetical protein
MVVTWRAGDQELRLSANLSERPQDFPRAPGRVIWHEGGAISHDTLPAWAVRWTVAGE